MLKNIIILLRVKQYIKNLFLFIPAFFAGKILEYKIFLETLLGFFLFCLVASSIYIFNDIMDKEEDKKHEKKKLRPIASGIISQKKALWIFFIFSFLGIGGSYFLNISFFFLIIGYFILNLFYSWKLKHISIIDIFIIALNFVLRIFAGGFIAKVEISMWLVLMVFLLSLFIALAKRRDDVLIFIRDGTKTRKLIEHYNLDFLNLCKGIMASVLIICYIFYTISPEIINKFHTDKLYLTSFFVILGIMRYLQLTFVYEESGSPTDVLLQDRFLQLIVFLWLATFGGIIYL